MVLTIEITLTDTDGTSENAAINIEAKKFARDRACVGMLVDDIAADLAADLEERRGKLPQTGRITLAGEPWPQPTATITP